MVIASYNLSENNRVPYVTIDEVRNSPTASSIDFTNLIENASPYVQEIALNELITVASTKADNYIFGATGTLCATVNTEPGRYRANRYGQIVIHPSFWPILEVRSVKIGQGPGSGLNDVTLNANNCWIERFQFLITPTYSLPVQLGTLQLVSNQWNNWAEQFVEYTYVNGFANAFLTTDISSGATTIPVTSAVGIYPGSTLTIWDGMRDEMVTIASTYDGKSLTLPLTAPLQFSHSEGVNVSALPATVKQAVIHFIVAMVKQRGSGGLMLRETGEPEPVQGASMSSDYDEALAYDLLDDFRQIWGRA